MKKKKYCTLCGDESPELSENGYCTECAKTEEDDPPFDELYPKRPVEFYHN